MAKLVERRRAEWDVMMKKAIYEATVEVLNERGFEGLTMERVAKAAEVATGTLYNYFKDKDDLTIHVIDTRFELIQEKVVKVAEGDMSPLEKMEAFVRTVFNYFEEHRVLLAIIFYTKGLSLRIRSHVNEKRETIMKLIAHIIAEGIEEGLFRRVDPSQTARLVFGALQALFEASIEDKRGPQLVEEDVSDCMSLFFSGLMAQPASKAG